MSKFFTTCSLLVAVAFSVCEPQDAAAREMVRGSVVKTALVNDALIPPEGYGSVEEAAIAASNRYNPDSIRRNREHAGAIVACEGGMFYTHGKGRSGVTPIRFSVIVPSGCKLQALWHTHGGRGRHREFFSASDTETANRLGVPFYLANYKGELRVFIPGQETAAKKHVSLSKPGMPADAAAGLIVQTGLSVTVATSS